MASCGLEAVNEPLEEAPIQLSSDSLRDHKNAPNSSNFSWVRCLYHEVFAIQPTASGKLMTYQLLYPVNEDIICTFMTIQKFHCSSTLH